MGSGPLTPYLSSFVICCDDELHQPSQLQAIILWLNAFLR
jgi:hypothetical protein